MALATGWGLVVIARVTAWFGRGARGPLRDSIMAESVPPAAYGRAFGFERAGDSLGAVVGPAVALALLSIIGRGSPTVSTYHWIFLTLERAIAADLLPAAVRATGFGVLATVNGVGDFLSSLIVGLLWTRVAPAAGFSYAAVLSLLGASLIFILRNGAYKKRALSQS